MMDRINQTQLDTLESKQDEPEDFEYGFGEEGTIYEEIEDEALP